MSFWIVAGSFLGALLGALGSEVARRVLLPSERLETRRDEAVRECNEQLKKISELGSRYWNAKVEADQDARATETTIKAAILDLTRRVGLLFQGTEQSMKNTNEEIKNLRKSVTGGNFGDGNPVVDKQRMQDTMILCDDLKRNIGLRRDKLRIKWF